QPLRSVPLPRPWPGPASLRPRRPKIAPLPASLLRRLGRQTDRRRCAGLDQRQPSLSRSHCLPPPDVPDGTAYDVDARGVGLHTLAWRQRVAECLGPASETRCLRRTNRCFGSAPTTPTSSTSNRVGMVGCV